MRPIRFSNFVKQATLIKSRLTTLDTQVSAFQSRELLSEAEIAKLRTIDETVIKKNNEFEVLLTKLFSADTPDEDIKDADVSKLQEDISDLYIKIHSLCSALAPAADPRLDLSHSSTQSGHGAPEPLGVRLPTLNLGVFTGQADKWIAFHSLFDSTVNKNPKLSDVEKFTYLLSCLTGEPLNLIKSLPITAANYHIAYQQLIRRYNNSRLLITLHINNILDLPTLHNSSVKQLRTFISSLQENVNALRALQHDICQESLFMTTYLLRKFDNDFRSKFEHSRADSQQMPTIQEVITFVERECAQLEAANLTLMSHKPTPNSTVQRSYSYNSTATKQPRGPLPPRTVLITASSGQPCAFCTAPEHTIYKCDGFSNLTPSERLKYVQNNSMCNNCLGRHTVRNCMSQRSCNVCNRRHHTMLHLPTANQQSPGTSNNNTKKPSQNSKTYSQTSLRQPNEISKNCATSRSGQSDQLQGNNSSQKETTANATALVGLSRISDHVVLLGTALVHLCIPNGNSIIARAVLDSAAQQTFITESCAKKLGISSKNRAQSKNIVGISSSVVPTKGTCLINISSTSGYILAIDHHVVILDKITDNLPRCHVSPRVRDLMCNLTLADPTFDTPASVDVLLGADLFAHVLNGTSVDLGFNMPTALNTIFGYVLIGNTPVQSNSSHNSVNLLTVTDFDLHSAVQRFWLTENLPEASKLSPEEQQCENHFLNTHSRLPDGKYQVRLPFKQIPTVLGSSSRTALCIFNSLEHRLNRHPALKKKYIDFMQDYENAGHMVVNNSSLPPENSHYFLPHHEVLRDDKIRVVFNASSATASGLSLNDIIHSGPKLHNDIPAIIMGFRRHRVVFTCDIRQMFRNIWIHPEDQDMQLIYWRAEPSQPVKIFKLTTVTYGMTSSPFLANRVVQQLIEDEGPHHPLAASALRGQIYVDDGLLGADTEEEALILQDDVISLMKKGGFLLSKWASNNQNILKAVSSDQNDAPLQFISNDQASCNVLGIKWLPEPDVFSYTVAIPSLPLTKRSVLSAIAHLYDPMGWLTPVIFWAKAFMQVLWTKGLQWDDPLPVDLAAQWALFLKELPSISDIRITRHVDTCAPKSVQLHGFCDASEAGYCASVILRVQNNDDYITTHLLVAKSRVAPLKKVSLPRLELCGAHMLSKLIKFCVSQLTVYLAIEEVYAWCDSTITLSWIQTPAYRLKTFVANRVAEIQDISIPIIWSHIASEQNPSDCGSRGIFPSLLVNHPLWWNGPTWLRSPQTLWPSSSFIATASEDLPEAKPSLPIALQSSSRPPSDILTRFSSWRKLVCVTAYVLRFINKCRKIINIHSTNTCSTDDATRPHLSSQPSIQEINTATTCILLLVQQETFNCDIDAIKKCQTPSLTLQRLSPFLDEKGLIRVGGRLSNSPLDYCAKHPILLPKQHFVTNLIIDYFHVKYLHCGPQILQSLLSQKYWILSARSVIRSRIFRCLRCYRFKPKQHSPFMADLPSTRVSPTRAFETSAVDFAGPFHVKLYNLRRLQHIKVYLCLFICMATKAVHLEVVTDLTTEAFIAALTRFISRRGIVKQLHSDNATNFVGAARQILKIIKTIVHQEPTQKYLTENGISFHFIPPRAPHFGGLWERAVQSAKHHLKRVIGDQVLSLEEFTTLTCRVEAMLNSRPITPLSSDPSELGALTPGHFLTGAPLVIVPELDLPTVPTNRLKRWQLVQSFAQHIWKRWHRDYLHTLQNRPKWTRPQRNLELDELVILQEDNVPPLQWKMGRISQLFPGKDGVTRVAEVKTASGIFRRPVIKLSPLPQD